MSLRTLCALLPAAWLGACEGTGAPCRPGLWQGDSALQVMRVRVEGLEAPLAVERPDPRITWNLLGTANGDRSIAFQVQATDAAGHMAWDSGRVERAQALEATWAGRVLRSRDRISLRIRAWDQGNRSTCWSAPATFEVGLLTPQDWTGQWIAAAQSQPDPLTPLPAPHLRREFTLAKPVSRARVYIAGLGYHEAYLNGQRPGDQVLEPGFTRFDRRTLYVAHEVGHLLRQGANVIGVILGNGFLNPSWLDAWDFQSAPWRATPRLLLQLEVEHPDGSRTVVASDQAWRTRPGPILRDAVRNGESYDARRELPAWAEPGPTDDGWTPVVIVSGPGGPPTARLMPPARVTATLAARAITQPAPGVYLFDFGQNLAGWARIAVSGPAGTSVALRYGERLAPDGTLDTTLAARGVLSGEFQTDHYVLGGRGVEVWEPRFVYHGFRYLEVRGLAQTPDASTVTARVVHTDFPRIGQFESSSELLNQLFQAAVWSYRSNFVSIPTDCPQREKNGWTADAHLAAELGLLAFDSGPGYAKWLQDLRDEQQPSGALPAVVPTGGYGYLWGNGPAWDSALFLVPWYSYLYTGDPRPLTDSAENMQRYLDYLSTVPYLDANPPGWLGDWVHLDQDTSAAVTHAIFHARDAEIAAVTARLCGDADGASRFDGIAAEVRRSFQGRYLDAATGRVANGTQTAQAGALYGRMVPDAHRAAVLAQLLANIQQTGGHINAGVLGAKWLPRALAAEGRPDVAYAMVSATDYPGWGNWMTRGATTLWENWDGSDSLNHAFFGDVAAWLMLSLGGIRPDPEQPGWKHIVFQPEPVDGLGWARAESLTSAGRVSSRWTRTVEDFVWDVSIPVGSDATLVIPFPGPREVLAPGTTAAGSAGGRPVLRAGSGDYRIRVRP